MAVTVKTVKKKKPLALKKGGGPAAPAGGEAAEGAEGAAPAAAVAAAPSRPVKPVKKASYTFAGVCAILEFLMFAAILTLQILEWKHYEAPPKNAFPRFGIKPGQIPISGGYSGAAAPVAGVEMADDLEEEGDFLDGEDDPIEDLIDEEAVPAE